MKKVYKGWTELYEVPDQKVKELKYNLTFVTNFEKQSTQITAFKELPNGIAVPRYYLPGSNAEISGTTGKSIKANFTGKLRADQLKALESFWIPNSSGIIVVACGFGKTVLGLYLTCEHKLKTAIIVDAKALADQWIEEISIFTDLKAGLVCGKKRELENDIVIFMAQTLNAHPLTEAQASEFGFVIVDEADKFSANSFNKVIGQFPGKLRLGLTATEHRGDGLTKVFKWHLGPVLYRNTDWKNNPTILKVQLI